MTAHAPLTDAQRAKVEQHIGLVHHALRRQNVPDFAKNDRFQDGCIGLMRAVQLYDPDLGYAFSTYAYNWVRKAMTRGHEAEDRNVRRAAQNGDEYDAPVSVDWTRLLHDEENDWLAVDDVEIDDLVDRLAHEQDVAALDLTDDERTLLAWTVEESARWFGRSHSSIVRSRRRLRCRLAAAHTPTT